MRRYVVLLIAALCAMVTWGQEAHVKDFYADPMDLAAQQSKYRRLDVQGNMCALIRVQVIADNVVARGSVIGDVVKNPGEYWVYMPGGAKMVKIQSDDFLPLMYTFPEPLHGGMTYTMRIEVPQAGGTTPKVVRQGYLLVTVTPPTATLTVGNEEYSPKDGVVKVLLRNGEYTYRVEAPGYFPSDGTVTIAGQTVKQTVALQSSKPQLSVRATTPGTQIYVNGELLGTGMVDCEAVAGLTEVEGRVAGYRTYAQTVELGKGEHREVVIPALIPMLGALNVDYEPFGAKISLDGREVGESPMIISDVLVGDHTVVVTAPDYQTASLTAKVTEGETAQLAGALMKNEKNRYVEEVRTFERNGRWGFKDEDGEEVIAPKYDKVGNFWDGMAQVRLNGKYGFVDKMGREVIAPKYDLVSEFSDGMAAMCVNHKWGFVNKMGVEVTAPKYDLVLEFSEGMTPVRLNNKWGFVDMMGVEVIPLKYDGAELFKKGKAKVWLNGQEFYIDKEGNRVQ